MAYLPVSPLGGRHDETWHGQGIKKHSVSWNLSKLCQLWQCNGGFRPRTTQNHLRTKQFMYHSRIVLSVGGSVWYVVLNHGCIITIDSVLANSKTENSFLFPVHSMFCHDCPLAVKSASTPRHVVHEKTWRDSLLIDMLPLGVTVLATVPQKSEILEGLMNYPV
jgi:hypothetical protein